MKLQDQVILIAATAGALFGYGLWARAGLAAHEPTPPTPIAPVVAPVEDSARVPDLDTDSLRRLRLLIGSAR